MEKEQRKEKAVRTSNRSIPLPGLRAARQGRGLTQRELAKLAGVGPGTVNELETGRRGGCYPRSIRRLANALDTDIEMLTEE